MFAAAVYGPLVDCVLCPDESIRALVHGALKSVGYVLLSAVAASASSDASGRAAALRAAATWGDFSLA